MAILDNCVVCNRYGRVDMPGGRCIECVNAHRRAPDFGWWELITCLVLAVAFLLACVGAATVLGWASDWLRESVH